MDDDAWSQFVEHLNVNLKARQWDFTINDEVIDIRGPVRRRIGLQNLAQSCATAPQAAWPSIIGEHLGIAELTQLPVAPDARWNDVQSVVKIRLLGDEPPDSEGRLNAQGVLAPGIGWALVYDLPDVIQFVRSDRLAAWSIGLPDLVNHACRNVREQDPPQRVRRHPLVDDAEFVTLDGPSHFVSTHAMWIEEYVREATELGVLVAVPDRHNVLAAAILDRNSTLTAIGRLFRAAREFHRIGPGSISPHLYWRRGNGWMLLPVTQDENREIELRPPPAFLEVLNNLPLGR